MSTAVHTTSPSAPRTGRPRVLDDAKRHEICILVSRGCSIKEAARYVGCAPSTIHRERESNERFRRKLARAKMKANFAPLRAMQRAMLIDWRAAAWFLERTQPEKFGRRNHRAFTQKQANALIKDISSIIAEEVISKALFDRLSSRIEAAVRYACHAHNDMNRTAAELGRAMKHHDMKSPRYSPSLADFPTSPPLASGASEFTRRGENLSPRAPATTAAPPKPQRTTPPQSANTPVGRTLAQQIVNFIDPQRIVQPTSSPPPTTPPPANQPPPPKPTQPPDFCNTPVAKPAVFPTVSASRTTQNSPTPAIKTPPPPDSTTNPDTLSNRPKTLGAAVSPDYA